jgi:transposase InsO family protein
MTAEELVVNQRRALLVYAERHGISEACRTFQVSRTTYYKLKAQLLKTGTLVPRVRRKPKMPNEMALSKKKLLLRLVQQHPSWGPVTLARAFQDEGIAVGAATLWYHLSRFGLNRRYQRLLYLERLQSAGQPVTERTIREVKRQCKEITRGLWPGHVVALDTFYVGHLKGVGRIYQMTGIDLCSRYGWAKLYLEKTQRSAIDLVESVLLPKFFDNGVTLESILTDNGSEFTGGLFHQMLVDYDIQHHRIPPGKPMLNGYCERFQRTILEEFYESAFRTTVFQSLAELQHALNGYLQYYNFQRHHFGLHPKCAIPINVFKSRHQELRLRFQKLLT